MHFSSVDQNNTMPTHEVQVFVKPFVEDLNTLPSLDKIHLVSPPHEDEAVEEVFFLKNVSGESRILTNVSPPPRVPLVPLTYKEYR